MRKAIALVALVALPLLAQVDWTAQVKNKPVFDVAEYNFVRTNGLGASGTLTSAGGNVITLTPCPKGIAGSPAFRTEVYIVGGTGTAESIPITGGTCTSNAATGTITLTTANTHSGSWRIESASDGVQEAVNVAGAAGGMVLLPRGNVTFQGTVTHGAYHSFFGHGQSGSTGNGTYIDADGISDLAKGAFEYDSAIAGTGYTVTSSISYSGFTIKAKNAFRLNRETPPTSPTFQGLLISPVWDHVNIVGTHAPGNDVNSYTANVPTLATLRGYGTGISCNSCYSAKVMGSVINAFGVGVVFQGDENEISGANRITNNGVNVWVEASLGAGQFHGGTNKILDSTLGGNYRVGAITLNETSNTIVQGNYFEAACGGGSSASAQFLRSTKAWGLDFSHNRVDDPDNGSTCLSTTPITYNDDYYGIQYVDNYMVPGGGAIPAMGFGQTYWSAGVPNPVLVRGNSRYWPTPSGALIALSTSYAAVPGVVVGELNPYLIRHNNVGGNIIAGTSPVNFAATWAVSAVTGRYVLTTGTNYVFRFFVQDSRHRNFLLRFTGLRIGTGAGAVTVQYIGTGTTTLYGGNLGFTATTETETKEIAVSIPASEVTSGRLEVTVDGSNAEFEQIEAIPLPVVVTPPVAFGALPACAAAYEGAIRSVTDSNTATWGATAAAGGANHVQVYCNGTNWTVVGK